MISPNLLSDSLAAKVATEVICTCCAERVEEHIVDNIINYTIKELLDNIMPSVSEIKRLALFEKLFKSLKPYEKQYKIMLATVWEKERKIIVSNLKKMKKAWLQKDKIDNILYPVEPFEKELSVLASIIIIEIMEQQGTTTIASIPGINIAFDVTNPEVQKWLKSYTPKFSKELETVNVAKLRLELSEGIAAGEGIPQLTNRVNLTYENWNKVRSEAIARSETMRASNQASIEAYKQSRVVKKKVWVTHFDDRTCAWCEAMDGTTISLEKSFFPLGSRFTVEGQTMKLDYEIVEAPPLHTRCRCTVSPWIEGA